MSEENYVDVEGEKIPVRVSKKVIEHAIKVVKDEDHEREDYESVKSERDRLQEQLQMLANEAFEGEKERLRSNYPQKASEIALIESPSQLESFKSEMEILDEGDKQPPPPPAGKVPLRRSTKSVLSQIEQMSNTPAEFINNLYDRWESARSKEEAEQCRKLIDSLWGTVKGLDSSVLKDRISRGSGMDLKPHKKKKGIEGSRVLP